MGRPYWRTAVRPYDRNPAVRPYDRNPTGCPTTATQWTALTTAGDRG